MNRASGVCMGAMLMGASGCSGSGEGGEDTGIAPPPPPPPPPPPSGFTGGIWGGAVFWEPTVGFPGGARNVLALVAETGEFRWMLPESDLYYGDDSEQVFGSLEFDGAEVRTTNPDAHGATIWATPVDSGNPTGSLWGGFGMSGIVEDRESFSGTFHSNWTNFEERAGTFSLHYASMYEHDSSLEILQGVYSTPTESLTIDGQGVIFYQSSGNGCTGNGSVTVIDSDFNMYRIAIALGSCTGEHAIRNGLTFTGLAFKGVNNDLSGGTFAQTIEIAVSAAEPVAFDTPPGAYFIWNLWAQKE
jgi:hypothetical protein